MVTLRELTVDFNLYSDTETISAIGSHGGFPNLQKITFSYLNGGICHCDKRWREFWPDLNGEMGVQKPYTLI